MAKVGVFFGVGFEEIEALTVVDLLRRVGIEVRMISINSELEVEGGHQITVRMDQTLETVDFEELEMIILPGGLLGTQNLEACAPLMEEVKQFNKKHKKIAAICAAPGILGRMGILSNKKACVYPGSEGELKDAIVSMNQVEVSEHIITSRGVGTTIPFALAIVEMFQGEEARNALAAAIVYE